MKKLIVSLIFGAALVLPALALASPAASESASDGDCCCPLCCQ